MTTEGVRAPVGLDALRKALADRTVFYRWAAAPAGLPFVWAPPRAAWLSADRWQTVRRACGACPDCRFSACTVLAREG